MSAQRVGRVAAVLVAVSLAASTSARAGEPVLHLEQTGRCPTAERLRRSLRAAFRLARARGPAPAGAWRLRLREGSRALRLELISPAGQRSLERALRSRDCDARADAVAIILTAHFVELSLPPALDPRIRTPAALASRPVAASRPAASQPSSRPAPPAPRPAPARRGTPRWLGIGLAGGVVGRLEPAPAAAALGQLDVALGPLSIPLGVRLAALLAQPTTQQATRDRTSIRRLTVRLDALWRVRLRRVWLQPALGGGVGLSWVTAQDLAGAPTTLRAQPLIAASLALGVPLVRGLSLRGELSSTVFLRADRYVITPDGEVARSARVTLLATVGLQLDTFW